MENARTHGRGGWCSRGGLAICTKKIDKIIVASLFIHSTRSWGSQQLVCGDANAKKISCIPSSVDRFLVLSFVTMSSASRIEYSEKYADDVNEYR